MELANETTRLDWLDSLCASRNNLRYSSPDANGSGVTRVGLVVEESSIHDSVEKTMIYLLDNDIYAKFSKILATIF
jgi:hypothetical protein